jgi:hypothetical protein
MDVEVNGVARQSNLQLADGKGTECFDIPVSDGDAVLLRYVCRLPFPPPLPVPFPFPELCGQHSWELEDGAGSSVLTGNGTQGEPVVQEATVDCGLPPAQSVGGTTEIANAVKPAILWAGLVILAAAVYPVARGLVRRGGI